MELSIRSQDKRKLIKYSCLYITQSSIDKMYIVWCNNEIVGQYITEKRALEILDEIQKLLEPVLVFKNCNCTKDMLDNIKEAGTCIVSDNSHIEQIPIAIYEMPEN